MKSPKSCTFHHVMSDIAFPGPVDFRISRARSTSVPQTHASGSVIIHPFFSSLWRRRFLFSLAAQSADCQRSSECPSASLHIEDFLTSSLCEHGEIGLLRPAPFSAFPVHYELRPEPNPARHFCSLEFFPLAKSFPRQPTGKLCSNVAS